MGCNRTQLEHSSYEIHQCLVIPSFQDMDNGFPLVGCLSDAQVPGAESQENLEEPESGKPLDQGENPQHRKSMVGNGWKYDGNDSRQVSRGG